MKTLLLLAILIPTFALLLSVAGLRERLARHWHIGRALFKTICVLIVLLTIGCGLFGVCAERIYSHDEASVLSIAAAFRHGQLLYPRAEAPVEYALLYGPVTFLVYLPPMFAGQDRLGAYQLWVLIALAGTYAFVYFALRWRFGVFVALGITALLAVFVSRFAAFEWGIKGDVWILFFSAIGMWGLMCLSNWSAAVVLAITGAMLVDLKVTTLVVAILPCILLWQRERRAHLPAFLSACSIPIFALLPFAMPAISLAGYAEQLRDASHAPFIKSILHTNLYALLLLFLPSFGLFWAAFIEKPDVTRSWLRRRAWYLLAFGMAALVAILTGARNGAGPWHCMVLAIPLLLVNTELWNIASLAGSRAVLLRPGRAAPLWALGVSMLAISISGLIQVSGGSSYDFLKVGPASMPSVERELIGIMKQYPATTLQMGYSDMHHYYLTFMRPVLQMHGNPLFIDPDARDEADLIGRPISPAVLSALGRCDIKIWILPRGGPPFSMEAPYFVETNVKDRSLYSEAFRRLFFASYQQIPGNAQYFDLWACRNGSKPLSRFTSQPLM